ncbi:NAD(P)H-hydrate dehydratase [bacterium]|nr:NAD(P)H-hydrate dehydratase [bacterium]
MAKYIDKKFLKKFVPKRDENSNKGSFGKILNIAGSDTYSGAALLSSVSALKTGAGYVCLACPKEIIPRIAPACPELTYMPLFSNNNGAISSENIVNTEGFNVISLGCGITHDNDTATFVLNTLLNIKDKKLILDADGINILSAFSDKPDIKGSIITPHPMELSRLLNTDVNNIISNREKYAKMASEAYNCITVLKGHNTIITNGKDVYINTTGSSALAKAGTGDVLTGIISGFAAQGLSGIDAAILGVYLHGLAGDLAAKELTKYCVLASDVIAYINCAFSAILKDE